MSTGTYEVRSETGALDVIHTQLSYEQRVEIHALLKAGCNQARIAQIIGVHKSTLSREIKRNTGQRGYRPIQANQRALDRIRGVEKPIRLMVSLQYLKYAYNLSDEEVVAHWLENPYWQYFSGMPYFQTECPIHPTSLIKFRQRLKDRDLEKLLKETIESAIRMKALKRSDFKQVNVDTTVMEKNISYPRLSSY